MLDTATGLAGHAANQGENRLGSHCRDWRNAGLVAKTKPKIKCSEIGRAGGVAYAFVDPLLLVISESAIMM